ncbi:ribonuclease R [Lawsonia intracellularis]|uniref:ribonuclease R n=1 Tax=Lawsonia intracellularis TaxID=29546 RepID=UPI000DE3E8F0|nr:ribonuclease R [Lawsonia intracellularis]RBN34798.1 ribonuclease R [Lawsonia intracellularis]RBN35940.1 ribonuclease R [Lawsonia intracellularis]UYH53524.1 ribonuclease R [Lawsonia intracellularis]
MKRSQHRSQKTKDNTLGQKTSKIQKHKPKSYITRQSVQPGSKINGLHILSLLYNSDHPLSSNEIITRLKITKQKKQALELVLNVLQKQGQIVCTKGEKWAIASPMQKVIGTFVVQRSGAAFVIVDQQNTQKPYSDIFIRPELQNGAWDGDKVQVIVYPTKHGKNFEGQVVQILERPRKEVIVRVSQKHEKGGVVCYPVDSKLNVLFIVDTSKLPEKPIENELLVIIPTPNTNGELLMGIAQYSLGVEEDVRVQEKVVKLNYNIPCEFPLHVLKEENVAKDLFIKSKAVFYNVPYQKYDDISQCSTAIRQDLRVIDFVTIDGEDAKDFDDAICVYPTDIGWDLWVAIADVSHFVRAGSLLDSEALARGNSYYFPCSVESMLPEFLSNDFCSLKPKEERLVMATKISFDNDGKTKNVIFFPGVISSRARLTYEQVHLALEVKEISRLPGGIDTLSMLNNASELAKVLQANRIKRGSLEFDLPETRFLINKATSRVIGVIRQERFFSHQLIEELMLAVNEAVATFLHDKQIPFLYRIHPEPDIERLEKLFRILATTDLACQLSGSPDAKKLGGILEEAENTPQTFLISRMVLRSMMQAKYSPEPGEHFGLASPLYCHFTSPIRRYADLLVHRAVKFALGDTQKHIPFGQQLFSIAEQCNSHERVAQEAEREITKRLSCLVLQGDEGKIFEAIVTGITDFAFFVELISMPIEGMVRLASLKDDWFEYNQDRQELLGVRTGKRFYLGQRLTVKVSSVNILRLEIEFELHMMQPTSGENIKKGRTKARNYYRQKEKVRSSNSSFRKRKKKSSSLHQKGQ